MAEDLDPSALGDKTPNTGAPPAGTPPAKDPPPGTPHAVAAPPAKDPAGAPPVNKDPVVLGEDDDDIPEGAPELKMNRNALMKRMGRYTRKQLKELFGTDNADEIKAKLKKAGELEAQAEEQRRAQLSELDRAKEDAAKWKRKADDWKTRHDERVHAETFSRETTRVQKVVADLVDPDFAPYELQRFAQHVLSLPKKERELSDAQIKAYFDKQVAERPKIGKGYAPGQTPPVVEKQPITNSTNDQGRPTSQGANGAPGAPVNGQRTMRPGLPNSMNSHEAREEAAKSGYRY